MPATGPTGSRRSSDYRQRLRYVLFRVASARTLASTRRQRPSCRSRTPASSCSGSGGGWCGRVRAMPTHGSPAATSRFRPCIPTSSPEWTASADVAMVTLPAVSLNQRESTPNKFWESLLVGTPIVLGADLDVMAAIVREARAGVVAASLTRATSRRPSARSWPLIRQRATQIAAGLRRSRRPVTRGRPARDGIRRSFVALAPDDRGRSGNPPDPEGACHRRPRPPTCPVRHALVPVIRPSGPRHVCRGPGLRSDGGGCPRRGRIVGDGTPGRVVSTQGRLRIRARAAGLARRHPRGWHPCRTAVVGRARRQRRAAAGSHARSCDC